MRWNYGCVYVGLFFFVQATGVSVKELLGTHQYLLVGLRQCTLSLETNVPTGRCPLHFGSLLSSSTEKASQRCRIQGATLLWSSAGDQCQPAELLVVGRVQSTLAYNTFPLHIPYRFENRTLTMQRAQFFTSPHRLTQDKLVGTVYDHRTQFLYLIFEREALSAMRAEVFLMERRGASSTKWRDTHKFSLEVHDSFFGSTWSSDPQSERAYYAKETEENGRPVVELRWIDFNQMVPALKNGRHGPAIVVAERSALRIDLQILHGLIYKRVHAEDRTGHQIIDPRNSERQLECVSSESTVPDFAFVVSGWEYCKVRDGASADRKRCENETVVDAVPQVDMSASHQPHGSSVGVGLSLLIVFSIVLNAVLCLCIGYCVVRSREGKSIANTTTLRDYTESSLRLHDRDMSF